MSELTDHLSLPASAPPEALRAAALSFLAGDTSSIPQPRRARLILAARRATGETFPRRERRADPDVAHALKTIEEMGETNAKLRQAAIGSGLPCRPPCRGKGRLHDVAPEGWAVSCRTCSRSVQDRTAGEAIRKWEAER